MCRRMHGVEGVQWEPRTLLYLDDDLPVPLSPKVCTLSLGFTERSSCVESRHCWAAARG